MKLAFDQNTMEYFAHVKSWRDQKMAAFFNNKGAITMLVILDYIFFGIFSS